VGEKEEDKAEEGPGWTCTVCTFRNDGDYDICAMCSRDRVQILREQKKKEMYINMKHEKTVEKEYALPPNPTSFFSFSCIYLFYCYYLGNTLKK